MTKEQAITIIKWIANTTIQAEKIYDHFGIKGQDRKKINNIISKIRKF